MSQFLTLLIQIMPLALGAAISPTALMGIILLLSISKRPKLQGFGYYFGAIILILMVIVLGTILSAGVNSTSPKSTPMLAGIDIVFGILLLVLGIKRIFQSENVHKQRFQGIGKKSSNLKIFMEGLSFGFGMFLINFSTTIIILEAAKEIAISQVDLMGKLIIVIILMFITLIVCEIPLGLYLLFPEKANNILSNVNKWMQKNGHYLMGVVILVIGIYILWMGLVKLGII